MQLTGQFNVVMHNEKKYVSLGAGISGQQQSLPGLVLMESGALFRSVPVPAGRNNWPTTAFASLITFNGLVKLSFGPVNLRYKLKVQGTR